MQGDWMKAWLPKKKQPPGILQVPVGSLLGLEQAVATAARSFTLFGDTIREMNEAAPYPYIDIQNTF